MALVLSPGLAGGSGGGSVAPGGPGHQAQSLLMADSSPARAGGDVFSCQPQRLMSGWVAEAQVGDIPDTPSRALL